MSTQRLTVALPNGTLLADACTLLARAGLATIHPDDFDRVLLVENSGAAYVKVRPTDVPVYVDLGGADVGIVGKDMLWEAHGDAFELVDLRFGLCRLVLAAPSRSPLAHDEWPPALRVATKYPKAAALFFDRLGIAVELIKLHGSIELAPLTGLADAILDITATGTTLRANDLVEVVQAASSTARLIVNHASLKTRSAEIDAYASALRRTVAGLAHAPGIVPLSAGAG